MLKNPPFWVYQIPYVLLWAMAGLGFGILFLSAAYVLWSADRHQLAVVFAVGGVLAPLGASVWPAAWAWRRSCRLAKERNPAERCPPA